MSRLTSVVFASVVLSASLFAAPQKYGKPLKLKEETKVSEILSAPEKFRGKLVRVRGLVTDVCADRGCFLVIAGDKRFQDIMLRVEEGVIVFPVQIKGREVVVEGTVDIQSFSAQELRDMCPIEAKALDPRLDQGKVEGSRTFVRLMGVGAESK